MWLMPEPPDFRPFCIQYPDEADITKIVDALRPLRIAMVIPERGGDRAHAVGGAVHAGQARADYQQRARRDQRRGGGAHPQDHRIGAWNVTRRCTAPRETNDANWKIIDGGRRQPAGVSSRARGGRGSKAPDQRFDLMRAASPTWANWPG